MPASHKPARSSSADSTDRLELINRYIRSFRRAVRLEMEAMKRRLGSFEVPLSSGRALGHDDGDAHTLRKYDFSATGAPNAKLVPGVQCTFRTEHGDTLVRVSSVTPSGIVVEAETTLNTTAERMLLVIYPWFLYEELLSSLESIIDPNSNSASFYVETALRAFGQHPARRLAPAEDAATVTARLEDVLNMGQIAAVGNALSSDVSFIWGPPGTGKTTTLVRLLEALAREGGRVLVASTTNAAVDQVIESLNAAQVMEPHIAEGIVLRMGRSDSHGDRCSLDAIRRRRRTERKASIARTQQQIDEHTQRVEQLQILHDRIRRLGPAGQSELFGPSAEDTAVVEVCRSLFGTGGERILSRPDREGFVRDELAAARSKRAEAGETLKAALEGGGVPRGAAAGGAAAAATDTSAIIREARVILTTLAQLYTAPALRNERFDAVIIEEAGMAVLPAVFFCAALAAERVVLVGDPRQLPPIVQSDSPYVKRAMGRSIFEVAVPHGVDSPMVSLLDRQYRMHPRISDVVSTVFYDGLLTDDPGTAERDAIAELPPLPGQAVAVVDLGGASSCRRRAGSSSRINEVSAARATNLAAEAEAAGIGSIGIITPYADQSRLIGRLIAEAGLTRTRVSTVHRFQGHEQDCIIFDFTDAPPLKPGVLLAGNDFSSQSANLLNVSISRARGKLVLIAERRYFMQTSGLGTVRRLLSVASSAGA